MILAFGRKTFSALLLTITIVIPIGAASAQVGASPNALAATPPMGWNSWNHYGCNISEKLIHETADALIAKGLKQAGYVYVNLDDCWQGDRDAEGNIQPDAKRFPSGMKALGDYLHSRGLKFGIYSDTGAKTCAGRPGSQGYEFQDARQYARWGVDYVKYDWCDSGKGAWQRNAREGYQTMRRAIDASGRPMIFSICEWGENKPWEWGAEVGQLWRIAGDITNCFDCVLGHGNWKSLGIMQVADRNEALRGSVGAGHWNDPDMLEVGNLATLEEDRTHFALWAIMAAPLIIGTDVEAMRPEVRDILANRAVIAVNQDGRAIQGLRWISEPGREVWAKPLMGGDWAVAVTNRGDTRLKYSLDWKREPLQDNATGTESKMPEVVYAMTDLWTGKAAGTTAQALTVDLAPHDTAIFRLTAQKGVAK